MERTLISINLPNILTIGGIAAILYVLSLLFMQFAMRRGLVSASSGGY